MEPLPRGSGIVFENDIFGGAIPRQYVPAVEKGIHESAARGYLAGYPVVDFKVTVFDGSYHDVDSSEMSFKMAARMAFRKCMEQAKPALLEPVMRVEIESPDEFAGALMADLNCAARARAGDGERGGRNDCAGRGSDGGDAELWHDADVDYAGARELPDGYGPLRCGAATLAEKILANARRPNQDELEE